jgi:hypothetical protein
VFSAIDQCEVETLTLAAVLKPKLDGATRDAEEVDEPDTSF